MTLPIDSPRLVSKLPGSGANHNWCRHLITGLRFNIVFHWHLVFEFYHSRNIDTFCSQTWIVSTFQAVNSESFEYERHQAITRCSVAQNCKFPHACVLWMKCSRRTKLKIHVPLNTGWRRPKRYHEDTRICYRCLRTWDRIGKVDCLIWSICLKLALQENKTRVGCP